MTYQKDEEVLALKRKAEADYRDLANVLGLSPSASTQRVLGFTRWRIGERERVIRFLKGRIAARESVNVEQIQGR